MSDIKGLKLKMYDCEYLNDLNKARKQGALNLAKQILDITNKSNIDVVEKLLDIHRLVEDKVSELEG